MVDLKGLLVICLAVGTTWSEDVLYSNINDAIVKSLSPRAQQILQHGLPGYGQLRVLQDFVISYDTRNRVPNWVMEHVTPANLGGRDNNVNRSEQSFYEDTGIHEYFRSQNADYRRSGFDRGHMAPAANHKKSLEHQRETFVLSNIAPQVGENFNRGAWNKLEMYVRDRVVRKNNETFICTGSLYLPKIDAVDLKKYVRYQVVGRNNVAVPTHFFKVILANSGRDYSLETYVLPNAHVANGTNIKTFLKPKEDVERASGLLIFNNIPKQKIRCVNQVCNNGNNRNRG